jgi:TPR repeat protein
MSIGQAYKGFDKAAEAEKRPACVKQEHLDYLDELRESGEVNMFAARPYVRDRFNLNDEDSATALGWYMKRGKD